MQTGTKWLTIILSYPVKQGQQCAEELLRDTAFVDNMSKMLMRDLDSMMPALRRAQTNSRIIHEISDALRVPDLCDYPHSPASPPF